MFKYLNGYLILFMAVAPVASTSNTSSSTTKPAFTAQDYFEQKAALEKTQAETRAKFEQQRQQAIQTAYSSAVQRSQPHPSGLVYAFDKPSDIKAAQGYKSFAEQRYNIKPPTPVASQPKTQPTNIFGATQGLSPDKPATIPTTAQQRANAFVTNIQTRQALPVATVTIPQNQNVVIGGQPVAPQQKPVSPGKPSDIVKGGEGFVADMFSSIVVKPTKGAIETFQFTQREAQRNIGADLNKAPDWVKSFLNYNKQTEQQDVFNQKYQVLTENQQALITTTGLMALPFTPKYFSEPAGKLLYGGLVASEATSDRPFFEKVGRVGTALLLPKAIEGVGKIPEALKGSKIDYQGVFTEKNSVFVGKGTIKGTPVDSVIVATPEETTLFVRSPKGLTKQVFEGEPLPVEAKTTVKTTLLTDVSQGGNVYATAIETYGTELKSITANVKLNAGISDIYSRNIIVTPEVTKVTEITPFKSEIKEFGIQQPGVSFGEKNILNDVIDLQKTPEGYRLLQVKAPTSTEISFYERFGRGTLSISEPSRASQVMGDLGENLGKLARSRKGTALIEPNILEPSKPIVNIEPSKLSSVPELRLGEFSAVETESGVSFTPFFSTQSKNEIAFSPIQIQAQSFKQIPSSLSIQGLQPSSAFDIGNISQQATSPVSVSLPKQISISKSENIFDVSPVSDTFRVSKVVPPELPTLPETNIPFDFGFNLSPEKRKKKGKAYIAYLKRKGQFKAVSKPTSLKAALDIGTKSTISTLGATFEVKPVGGEPFDISTGGEFQKYGGYFRSFKLKKGQRQPLPELTFIQKRGTRLGSLGEVMEIQKARQVKMFG